MKTDLQRRREKLADIVLLADIAGQSHVTLRQQLESLTNLGIDVIHEIVTRISVSDNSFERNYGKRSTTNL